MPNEPDVQQLKDKLNRAIRDKAVLAERSKRLAEQIEDFRKREDQSDHLVNELIERQREMNFMLHRATSFLQRIQEANAVLSTEFTELVKELPAPSAPDWEERVSKINELFKMTGDLAGEVQDEIFRKSSEVVHKKPETTPLKQDDSKPAEVVSKAQEDMPKDVPVEPEVVAEPVTVSELQPEKDSDEQFLEHEIVVESGPVEGQLTEPVDAELKDRLDRLFGQIQDDESQQNPNVVDPPKKPGILSRLFGKKSKSIDKPQADDLKDQKENDAVAKFSMIEPHNRELSDLLGDTAREVGNIFLEDITPQQTHPYNEAPEQPVQKLSWWARWKKQMDEKRYQRVMMAIKRHEMRKLKRV